MGTKPLKKNQAQALNDDSWNKKLNRFLNNDNVAGYIFILPWLIGFFAFALIPVLTSFYLSFTEYDLLSPSKFVGFRNYIEMLTGDKLFWKSLGITFFFVFVAVPLRLVMALFIAMLFTIKTKLSGLYRAVYYIPSIVGGSVAVAVMWGRLFDAKGAINAILMSLNIIEDPIYWTGNPKTIIWVVILLTGWQFGSSMLIFLAGLQQIPASFYEAADIDGANFVQKFFKITVPMLTPVILFNLIMQMINGFMMFTQAFILTNGEGGPLNSLLVYSMYLYRRTFEFYQMGYGSAMAWFMLVIIAIFTAIIFKTSDQWVYYEAKED